MADREMLMKCARALFELDQEQLWTQYTTNPIMYGIKGKVSWDHITDQEKELQSDMMAELIDRLVRKGLIDKHGLDAILGL